MSVLRALAAVATLIALLAVGAALGDFASDPSPLGAVGLLIVVAGMGFALARLYGPQGVSTPGPPVSRAVAPRERKAPRRRPRGRASVMEEAWAPAYAEPEEAEHLWAPERDGRQEDEDRRRRKAQEKDERRREAEERRRAEAEAKAQRKADERRRREAQTEERRRAEAEAERQRQTEAEREAEAEAERQAAAHRQREAEAERRRNAEIEAQRQREAEAASPPARKAQAPRRGLLGRRGRTAAGLLDLNRAAAHEIAALPGVGPASGERVVEDRQRNGPFADVYDLTRVEGFSEARIRRFADKVTV